MRMTKTINKIKYYLYYWFAPFSKKILIFALAVYLAKKFSFYALAVFLLHYGLYQAIYFFNDYFDREKDKKRKNIPHYKLAFNKDELFLLFSFHTTVFTTILLLLQQYLVALITLIQVIVGMIRTFIHQKLIRRVSIALLQIPTFYIAFFLLGKTNAFYQYFPLVIYVIWLNILADYIIKEKAKKNSERLFYLSVTLILIVFLIIYEKLSLPILIYILSLGGVGIYYLFKEINVTLKNKENHVLLALAYLLSIAIIILSIIS